MKATGLVLPNQSSSWPDEKKSFNRKSVGQNGLNCPQTCVLRRIFKQLSDFLHYEWQKRSTREKSLQALSYSKVEELNGGNWTCSGDHEDVSTLIPKALLVCSTPY